MSIDAKMCVRIIAYIVINYGAVDKSVFPTGPIPSDHPYPAEFLGFSCDVTVEIESKYNGQSHVAFVDHYGDGVYRQTFEEAQAFVLRTTGVLLESMPERMVAKPPPKGEWGLKVAKLIVEFTPSGKTEEQVLEESLMDQLIRSSTRESSIGPPPSTLIQ